MFCVRGMHILKGRCFFFFFFCICKEAPFEDPSMWCYEVAFLYHLLFCCFLKVLGTPTFCSFQYNFASVKCQDNLCMETTGKQKFVWEDLVNTENGWHFGKRRRRSLSVRTQIQCNVRVDQSPCSLFSKRILKIPILWITVILFISIFARYKLEIVGGMGPTVGMVSRFKYGSYNLEKGLNFTSRL